MACGHLFHLVILLSAVIFLSSCSSVLVSQDYDLSYPLRSANSFGWNIRQQQENNKVFKHDELQANRFKIAIERVLKEQGLTHTGHPDLLVSYRYSVASKIQSDQFNSHFMFGFGSDHRRHGYYHGIGIDNGPTIHQYDQGKLVITLHSAESGQLVWKGTGTREVNLHTTPVQLTRRINEMVEAVLIQFRPLNK